MHMYMYMHIYAYIYIHTYIYMYIYVYIMMDLAGGESVKYERDARGKQIPFQQHRLL